MLATTPPPSMKPRSTAQNVYALLRSDIVLGVLRPLDPIRESEIAERLARVADAGARGASAPRQSRSGRHLSAERNAGRADPAREGQGRAADPRGGRGRGGAAAPARLRARRISRRIAASDRGSGDRREPQRSAPAVRARRGVPSRHPSRSGSSLGGRRAGRREGPPQPAALYLSRLAARRRQDHRRARGDTLGAACAGQGARGAKR